MAVKLQRQFDVGHVAGAIHVKRIVVGQRPTDIQGIAAAAHVVARRQEVIVNHVTGDAHRRTAANGEVTGVGQRAADGRDVRCLAIRKAIGVIVVVLIARMSVMDPPLPSAAI